MGLVSQISTNDNLLGMPRRNNSVLVRNKYPPLSTVMSISIKEDFICARSVGPFGPPKEEKGVQHMFFFFLENCSLGLHGICSMSATDQYQLIWQVIFHSVRSSALWRGVKTRPNCGAHVLIFLSSLRIARDEYGYLVPPLSATACSMSRHEARSSSL